MGAMTEDSREKGERVEGGESVFRNHQPFILKELHSLLPFPPSPCLPPFLYDCHLSTCLLFPFTSTSSCLNTLSIFTVSFQFLSLLMIWYFSTEQSMSQWGQKVYFYADRCRSLRQNMFSNICVGQDIACWLNICLSCGLLFSVSFWYFFIYSSRSFLGVCIGKKWDNKLVWAVIETHLWCDI